MTPKQGMSVAGMVEEKFEAIDAGTRDEIRGLRADLAADRKRMPILLRDAALLAMA
jgi:hypothetical protein